MNPTNDTLNISPLRRPVSVPQDIFIPHPDAAAAARAKIAALTAEMTTPAPSLPTNQLLLDRAQLASTLTNPAVATGVKQPPVIAPVVLAVAAKRRIIPSALKPFLSAAGIFIILLILLKSPIIYNELKYTVTKPAASSAAIVTSSTIPAAETINIPKINVNAPVVYEPSIDEAAVQKALENGVIHYGNTPVPGAGGNSVLFGHSSNDWWEAGNYKFIFSLLDKLTVGDEFTVDYQSVRYTYRVNGTKIVAPTDVNVLNSTPTPTMTLITCTPPGTSLKRLIVTADLVSTSNGTTTAQASPSETPVATTSTSNSSSSIWSRLGQVISSSFSGFSGLFGGSSNSQSTTTTSAGSSPATIPATK